MTDADHMQSAVQGAAAFRTTRWSLILRVGNEDERRAREALEELCQAYWYPLYAYTRRRGWPPEDAQDCTQGFFASLLERQDLARISPEKGRFRTFLLAGMAHYLANEWRHRRRQKRGGDQAVFSLDALSAEERYGIEPVGVETPERLYERRWAWEVLAQAMDRLAREYADAGKADLLDAFKSFLTGGGGTSRAEIAARLGISAGAVDVAIHRLRRRYGQIIRELVAETVASPEDVDEEIRYLMMLLSA